MCTGCLCNVSLIHYMLSVLIVLCVICKVSVLTSALYAMCPYELVLYVQSVLSFNECFTHRRGEQAIGERQRLLRSCCCRHHAIWTRGSTHGVQKVGTLALRAIHERVWYVTHVKNETAMLIDYPSLA